MTSEERRAMIAGWADEEAAPDTNATAAGESQKQMSAANSYAT